MKQFSVTTLLGLGLAAASLVVSVAPSLAAQAGGSLVVAIAAEPRSVNPAITTSAPDQLVGCSIYEGLTKVAGNGEIVPLLAKSWTISDDGKTYTFKLKDAEWHDGQKFTSADVQFSLTQVNAKMTPAFASGAGKALESVDAPMPDEVVLHLKKPFGPMLRSLACLQGGAILPKHVFEGHDIMTSEATTSAPVGTGPFKLGEWQRGEYIRLVKNDKYWDAGKPYLDEVIVRPIPQASSRTQALQAGEVDLIPYFYLASNDIAVLRKDSRLTVTPAKLPPSQDMLFFNLRKDFLKDKRVRQALMMATDRQFILKNGWLGFGDIGDTPFARQLDWAVDPALSYAKLYPFDVAKANALLDEAGYKRNSNGIRFDFSLVFVSDEVDFPRVALAIKQMWSAVGVNVILGGFDRPTAEKRVFTDVDFDGHLNGYTSFGDPALGLARIWVSSAIGRPYGNPSGYSNPAVDAAFAEGESRTLPAERGEIYKSVQKTLADELPVLTIHERTAFDAYVSRLKGLDNDSFLPTFADAWLEQ